MLKKVLVFENEVVDINYKARKPTLGPELELTNQFISSITQNYKSKSHNLALFVEPKITSGYPDVVIAEYHPRLMDTWVEERKILASNDFTLLSILYSNRIMSFQQIVDTTHLSNRDILISTEKLLDCKMIDRKKGQWTLVNKNKLFTIRKISAVEAKINNWQSALTQASLNIGYASESFILSNVKSPKMSTIELIKEHGIGIYNIQENQAKIISEAKNFPMANNKTVWQFNEWIGRKLFENAG